MITIPASLRKKYGLQDGDQVIVVEDEGMLKIIPLESIKSLQNRSITTKEMLEILKRSILPGEIFTRRKIEAPYHCR